MKICEAFALAKIDKLDVCERAELTIDTLDRLLTVNKWPAYPKPRARLQEVLGVPKLLAQQIADCRTKIQAAENMAALARMNLAKHLAEKAAAEARLGELLAARASAPPAPPVADPQTTLPGMG